MSAMGAVAFGVGAMPRVNLMPKAEIQRRERARLLARWLWGLVVALLVVVLATAGTFWLQFTAAQRLAAESARTQSLLTELASLSDVRTTLDAESELSAYRTEAMATDFSWKAVIAELTRALPAGAAITGYTLTPGAAPAGDDPAAEAGATGTVTVASGQAEDIVELVRDLRPLPSVIEADGWQVTSGDGGYIYQLTVILDQTIYTGAYAEEESE